MCATEITEVIGSRLKSERIMAAKQRDDLLSQSFLVVGSSWRLVKIKPWSDPSRTRVAILAYRSDLPGLVPYPGSSHGLAAVREVLPTSCRIWEAITSVRVRQLSAARADTNRSIYSSILRIWRDNKLAAEPRYRSFTLADLQRQNASRESSVLETT